MRTKEKSKRDSLFSEILAFVVSLPPEKQEEAVKLFTAVFDFQKETGFYE